MLYKYTEYDHYAKYTICSYETVIGGKIMNLFILSTTEPYTVMTYNSEHTIWKVVIYMSAVNTLFE